MLIKSLNLIHNDDVALYKIQNRCGVPNEYVRLTINIYI